MSTSARPCSLLLGCPLTGTRCPNGHEFEAIHGMGGRAPTACKVCGAAPVTRVFYPISVSFTGPGFYATDYGRGEQKSEAATSDGDGAKASNDSAKKTDEKSTKKPSARAGESPGGKAR